MWVDSLVDPCHLIVLGWPGWSNPDWFRWACILMGFHNVGLKVPIKGLLGQSCLCWGPCNQRLWCEYRVLRERFSRAPFGGFWLSLSRGANCFAELCQACSEAASPEDAKDRECSNYVAVQWNMSCPQAASLRLGPMELGGRGVRGGNGSWWLRPAGPAGFRIFAGETTRRRHQVSCSSLCSGLLRQEFLQAEACSERLPVCSCVFCGIFMMGSSFVLFWW